MPFFRDLQKTPACKIPELLGRTVWLIFENGECRQLKGRGFVRPDQDAKGTLERILKDFDQSIREARADAVFSLVAGFPIQTSEGLLGKDEFRDFLKRATSQPSPEPSC